MPTRLDGIEALAQEGRRPTPEARLPNLKAAILYLANRCDYATTRDGRGFSKWDASFGHELADRILAGEEIPPATARKAFRMLKKYAGQLAAGGIDLALIEQEIARLDGGAAGRRIAETQAEELVALALDSEAELFHTPDLRAYATIPVAGHWETWPIVRTTKGYKGHNAFAHWLTLLFYREHDKPPDDEALRNAIAQLEAMALFDGPEIPVFTRLGEKEGAIYLDLCDEEWRAVKVTASGWRVTTFPEVKFRRARGMLPLPIPAPEGTLEELRRFVNVPDEAGWRLLVAWLVAALRPRGPFTVLLLEGEQGSAKSTTARVLRALVDPNTAPLRTVPKDERDLMIAAANSWVVAFDNLSGVPPWLSDAICRLATGGGFATRMLYTDEDEVLFAACRPVVANGIDQLATRHDLLDRAIVLSLPPIPEEKRLDEATFWEQFEAARPRVLGALLDAVAAGLRNVGRVKLDRLPRMADFAKWVAAAEEALPWPAGGFLEAYLGNRAEAVEEALEADTVAAAVKALLEKHGNWQGTASDLLAALEPYVPEGARRTRGWPSSPKSLGSRLRRAATFLRQVGVDIAFEREPRTGRRIIRLGPARGAGLGSGGPGPAGDGEPESGSGGTEWVELEF